MIRSKKLSIGVAIFAVVSLTAISAMAFDFGDFADILKFKKFCKAPVLTADVTFGAGTNGHQLDPNEVTIAVGGTVSFNVVGGGHRVLIYPVSMNTDRKDIDEDLDPNCVDTTDACGNGSRYLVTDAKDNLIVDTTPVNPPFAPPAAPNAAVINYPVGRIAYTGDASVQGLFPFTFPKTGKYLVLCANRNHLNDEVAGFMYGFVNVIDCAACNR
ncbi:MAG: hypothetical protein AB9873_09790 [Syntrophobacteraceae bacterium]